MSVGAIGGGMAMGGMGAMGGAGATGAAATGAASSGAAAAGETAGASKAAGQSEVDGPKTSTTSAKPWQTVAEMGEFAGNSGKDLNSIDLLIALLLAAAMQGKDDDESSGGAAAMGFLAGLAMASQLGQSQSVGDMQAPVQEVSGGNTGGNINLTA
jgi:hypothetical protein